MMKALLSVFVSLATMKFRPKRLYLYRLTDGARVAKKEVGDAVTVTTPVGEAVWYINEIDYPKA